MIQRHLGLAVAIEISEVRGDRGEEDAVAEVAGSTPRQGDASQLSTASSGMRAKWA